MRWLDGQWLTQFHWDSRYTVLSLCFFAYFAIRFTQLLISPAIPAIIETFGISRSTVGIALTGMWIVYAFSQLPSGVYGNMIGGRQVILIALSLCCIGGGVVAGAPSYAFFFGFVLFLGLGAGLYYNAATVLLTRVFDNTGQAIGLHRVGSDVAGLIAPLVAAIALQFGWRITIFLGAVVVVVVLAMFRWTIQPIEPLDPDTSFFEEIDVRTLGKLLSRPGIAFATLIAILGQFVSFATMTWLPTFFIEYHAFQLRLASRLFAVFFVAVAVAQPVSGWLSDRIGRDRTLTLAMGAGVSGYALLSIETTVTSAVPAVILAGLSAGWVPPLQSRVLDTLQTAEQGAGFGIVRTLYILIGALGSVVTGMIVDLTGWMIAFGLLTGMLTLAFLFLVGTQVSQIISIK